MSWKFDKTRPICPQIGEQLAADIACGRIAPGQRLYSVREVAVRIGVNPNTVQKAFEQLEAEGLIYSVRGSGWFAAEDANKAKEVVARLIRGKTAHYFSEMELLGLSAAQTKKLIEEWEHE